MCFKMEQTFGIAGLNVFVKMGQESGPLDPSLDPPLVTPLHQSRMALFGLLGPKVFVFFR